MKLLSLSSTIKLALLLSLSFTAATPLSSSFLNSKSHLPLSLSSLSLPSSPPPKATTTDLLSLLGPTHQASKVNSNVARELCSCFKFLVPFNSSCDGGSVNRRSTVTSFGGQRREIAENEMVWWPPSPVMELARISVDSGGDPGAIHRALDPTIIPVPDVEGTKEDKCELTRTPYGRRFINNELNDYLAFLFEMIATRCPSVGLNVSLNRYGLFHGHLFLAKDTGRLGILFHAKEYPAYDKETFPYNLGYCQRGSDLAYDSTMNLRNILWLAPMPSNSSRDWVAPGVLVVLDARPDGIIYRDLIPEYAQIVRTLYEDDFGEVPVDVNYLNVGDASPNYQIFIC